MERISTTLAARIISGAIDAVDAAEPIESTGDPRLDRAIERLAEDLRPVKAMLTPESEQPLLRFGQGRHIKEYYPSDFK